MKCAVINVPYYMLDVVRDRRISTAYFSIMFILFSSTLRTQLNSQGFDKILNFHILSGNIYEQYVPKSVTL